MLDRTAQRLESLRDWIAGGAADRHLHGRETSVALADLARGTSLGGRLPDLAGRSVLIRTADQLTAALALIELDGVARRLVLCPPDLSAEHVPSIATTAAVDAVVSDRPAPDAGDPDVGCFVTCSPTIQSAAAQR